MNNLILDFEQAKSKHLLFKSRLRSILYDIPVDEGPVLSHHECSVGKWIYGHALKAYGHIPEMLELEMVHADIHISARKLVALHKAGKAVEARKGLSEMELVADRLIGLLGVIEQKLEEDPVNQPTYDSLAFKFEEYHDLLRSNAELDKRIKQQIAESNESALKYETVLAALHEGIIIQDANGVLQSANHSAERLLGLTLKQMRGLTSMDPSWKVIYEDGTPMPGQEHAPMLALKTGRPCVNQLMGIGKPDGSSVWLRVNAQPLINTDGEITGVVSSFFDVTVARETADQLQKSFVEQQSLNEELAAANEEQTAVNEELTSTNEELVQTQRKLEDMVLELAESEDRFRNLVLLAPVGICMIKGDPFQVQVVNDTFLEIIGRKRENFENQSYLESLPEAAGFYKPIIENLVATGKPYLAKGHEIKLLRNNIEQTIYVDFVYEPIRNADNSIDTILIVANEVTEQVTARKKAEQAEENLRMATESADLGTWMIKVNTREFTYSSRLKEIFGFEPGEELPYDAAISQILPDYQDRVNANIETALSMGVPVNMEYPITNHKDGKTRWIKSIGKMVYDQYGQPNYVTGVINDITEQKQDEIRKNDFIGMVSHELKTPLTSLTAIVQVANAKVKSINDAFLAGAMDKANVQVKKMSKMINGFLNISRLESGKLQIIKQPFKLEDLLDDVIEETSITITSHEIVFKTRGSIVINADKDKIGSVISNLLSNAIKYSPKGKIIDVKCELDGLFARVSIRDEGLGIKPQDAKKLFERYYRVESDHTQHISGFGIGLYLSAEIVKRHEGKIWLESEIGQGSTFYFTIPVG